MKKFRKIVLSLTLFLLIGIVLVGCKKKDSTILKEAKEALKIVYVEGEDIVLPSKEGKVDILWESSHSSIISNKGKVIPGEEDIMVTLTAKFTYKSLNDEREFKFNVKARVKTDAEKATLAKAALNLPSEIDNEANLSLVNEGAFGAQITWVSSNTEIIDPADGSVVLPEEDTVVTLTATIKIGSIEEIKEFEILVKERPKTDAEKVLRAKNALSLPDEKADEIAFDLVDEGEFNAQITWVSSNTEIIDPADGSVVLPEEDTVVTLTATIKIGSIEEIKEFEILVKERPKTDAEKVLRAKNALSLPDEKADEIAFDLVDEGEFNAQITWVSSNTEIIDPADGSVVLPEEDTVVTLTATIKIGSIEEIKEFEILVKERPKTDAEKALIAKEALVLPNEKADEIAFDLVDEGEFNAQITWVSSNTEIIDPADGSVVLPEEDTTVTLTATIKVGTAEQSKIFEILVKERPKTDAEKALRAKNALLLPTEKADEVELILLNEGEFNAQITWTSSHEEIIDVADGTVVLPEEETIVTLTATIKVGTAEEIKEFEILVRAYDVEEKIFAALGRIIVVPEFASGYQEENFNAVETTYIKGYEVVVTWTSSNEEAMLADGSLVNFYYVDEQTVTLTATITFKDVTKEATTKVMKVKGIELNISEVKDLEAGIEVKFNGIVTGLNYDQIIVDDNTAAIYITLVEANENLLIGDEVIVLGKTQVAYSRLQIASASITVESSGNQIPPGIISFAGLTHEDQGLHITISNLTVISGTKTMIRVTDGINDIMVYGSHKSLSLTEKMAPIRVGTKIDLIRAHIGVNSGHEICINVFDASEIAIDLTNEEIVARSAEALEIPEIKGDLEPLDVPRYGKYGGQIIWTSSNNDVINQETGEVTLPDYDITITITAKVFIGEIEETKTFYVLVKRTLVGIRTLPHNTNVEFVGIVTRIDGNTIIVNDYFGAMFVDVTTKPSGLAIGDEVYVIGKINITTNVARVKQATMEIQSIENTLPDKLTSLAGITQAKMGQRFNVENVQVSYYHALGQYNVTDGENEIALWYAGEDQTIKDYLSPIQEGTLLDLNNVHLFYTSPTRPYLIILNIDDIVINLTDLEKATLDLDAIILPETLDEDTTLTLPLLGSYGSIISWETSNNKIINRSSGKVLIPLITEVVTLTAIVEVNEQAITKTFEIECIGKPRTFEAKYTGTTNIVMVSPGNNADKLGLNPEIFTVSSNRLKVAPRKYLGVALVSTGKIVLGEVNGEGHILGISVGSDYNITNIKISYGVPSSLIMIKLGDHPSTTGPTIAGATVTYNDLNINEFVIRNVGTGALEITSILITVAVK